MRTDGNVPSSSSSWWTSAHHNVVSYGASPLIAGVSGGLVSTLALYPLDLVKVRMQVDERSDGRRASATSRLRRALRAEGVRGLYRGLGPALVGSGVSWGGYFWLYESIRTAMVRRSPSERSTTAAENFGAACAAGAALVGLTNPVWLIKTRMQTQSHAKDTGGAERYRGTLHAARVIVRDEGVLALYKGTVPALLLTSHGGVQFVVYEALKKEFGDFKRARGGGNGWGSGGVWERLRDSTGYLTMGAVSKIVASTTTYPLQVIKSRIQRRYDDVDKSREYRGVWDAVKRIWRHEGVHGFFKGCLPNAIRVAPSAAVTFLVYEGVMDAFRD